MLNRLLKSAGTILVAALTYFAAVPQVAAQVITSGADSTITNGWWDSTQVVANEPGEMTVSIAGVVSGIPTAQLGASNTLTVDSCYAISSLESLQVDTTNAAAYDTLWFPYTIQNQGNLSDSLLYRFSLVDTNDAGAFMPLNFDLWEADSTTPLSGVDSISKDTLEYGLRLSQDAINNLLIRAIIPNPLTAQDEDTLRIGVTIKDNNGTGAWDAWPDTVAGSGFHSSRRLIVDTAGTWLHTDSVAGVANCLLDHGDTQTDTIVVAIAAPIIRLAKSVTPSGSKVKPGDTLTYTIVYDNDGSSETRDMLNIVDMLPAGVMYIGIDSLSMDTTARAGVDTIDVDYMVGNPGTWQDGEPATTNDLLRVTGLRFRVPEGVGGQSGDNAGLTVADDSVDSDAGFVRFKVLVR